MASATKKYYAVRNGKVPGIYKTWAECKKQVNGYPGAIFKSFKTEEEAKEFIDVKQENKNLSLKTNSSKPYAFVDGSFNDEDYIYGFGGFLSVNGVKYKLQGCGDEWNMASMRNVAGEIEGAKAAVELAEYMNLKELTIYHDYEGIARWAEGDWKTTKTGTIEYAKFMQSSERTVKLSFVHVKGHTNVEGNEIADLLAKMAVGIRVTKTDKNRVEEFLERVDYFEKFRRIAEQKIEQNSQGSIEKLCEQLGNEYSIQNTEGEEAIVRKLEHDFSIEISKPYLKEEQEKANILLWCGYDTIDCEIIKSVNAVNCTKIKDEVEKLCSYANGLIDAARVAERRKEKKKHEE